LKANSRASLPVSKETLGGFLVLIDEAKSLCS
jgi:hypothetical protein